MIDGAVYGKWKIFTWEIMVLSGSGQGQLADRSVENLWSSLHTLSLHTLCKADVLFLTSIVVVGRFSRKVVTGGENDECLQARL